MASKKNGTLYVGVTNNLKKRVWEHKHALVEGFTKKYAVSTLVWFEETNDIREAILKEKQIKKWNRQWKINVITKMTPEWDDLYTEKE